MQFSLRLNNDLPITQYIELVQRAEDLDFDQIWVSNDLFLRSAGVILTAMALNSDRIQMGSCILNPYTMNPAEIAMMTATLSEVSDGRFLLGISAGAAEFLGWLGILHGSPLTAMRESVAAIRRLLNDENGECEGEFISWKRQAFMRFPVERQIPIYIGGMGPKMLQLAGEIGDGALPLLFPPERFHSAQMQVGKGLAIRTHQPIAFDFATCIWVSASDDRVTARKVLAHKVAYYGSAMNESVLADLGLRKADFEPIEKALIEDRNEALAIRLVSDDMLRIGVVGNAVQIIDRLEPLVGEGATHLSFGPPIGPDFGEALRILGEVVQHFRRQ